MNPTYSTELGLLYQGDCLEVLSNFSNESVDLVFADPPFNLGKDYGSLSTDLLPEDQYLTWCQRWISECERVLKKGGSFFIYNLPKWNIHLGMMLGNSGLEFRHWIAVEHKSSLPIQNKLYPAHYSLLYYTKGKPERFQKIRTPFETCRHCQGELKDYGGHRKAMNPHGVSLKDVWTDIPPVRHKKFKPAGRKENALSTKLLERVIEIASFPGDLVLDPFGGSGTTYAVCEQRNRRWLGIELEDISPIIDRLENKDICNHKNDDYVELSIKNPHLHYEAAE